LPLVIYSDRELSEAEMAKLRLGPTEFLRKSRVAAAEVESLATSMMERLRQFAPEAVA
jgi:hypothetical protein